MNLYLIHVTDSLQLVSRIFKLFVFLFLSNTIFSQNNLADTVLNELIVTASRYEESNFHAARSVSVISKEDIENSVYHSLGELLSDELGLYVVGNAQTPGSIQSLFMRGNASQHVNLIVDGVRVSDPTSPNGSFNFSEISLTNIEKIEIVRGSHGTMYGSGGIGGVIQIFTKEQNQGFSTNGDFMLGHLGGGGLTTNQNLMIGFGKNGFYANSTVFNSAVNGLDATTFNQDLNSYSTQDKDDFKKTDYSIKMGYKLNKIESFVSYKNSKQEADIDNGPYRDDDNALLNVSRNLLNYSLKYKNKKLDFELSGGFSNSTSISKNDSSIIDYDGTYDGIYYRGLYTGGFFTNEFQTKYREENLTLVGGISFYHQKMNFQEYIDGTYSKTNDYDSLNIVLLSKNIFGSVAYSLKGLNSFFENWHFSSSLRYNYLNNNRRNYNFDLSLSYRRPNTMVYYTMSQGFKNPSLLQLYDPTYNTSINDGITRGNQYLKPESSKTFELGLRKRIKNLLKFHLALFYNDTDNTIEYVYLWDNSKKIKDLSFSDNVGDTYMNLSNRNSLGIEIETKLELSKGLELNANFSYLKGNVMVNQKDLQNDYTKGYHVQLFNSGNFMNSNSFEYELIRIPSYQVLTSIAYRFTKKVKLESVFKVVDSRFDIKYDYSLGPYGALETENTVARYHILDFNLNYKISDHVFTIFRIENLLNSSYSEIDGYNTKGRSYYFKLGFSL